MSFEKKSTVSELKVTLFGNGLYVCKSHRRIFNRWFQTKEIYYYIWSCKSHDYLSTQKANI